MPGSPLRTRIEGDPHLVGRPQLFQQRVNGIPDEAASLRLDLVPEKEEPDQMRPHLVDLRHKDVCFDSQVTIQGSSHDAKEGTFSNARLPSILMKCVQ